MREQVDLFSSPFLIHIPSHIISSGSNLTHITSLPRWWTTNWKEFTSYFFLFRSQSDSEPINADWSLHLFTLSFPSFWLSTSHSSAGAAARNSSGDSDLGFDWALNFEMLTRPSHCWTVSSGRFVSLYFSPLFTLFHWSWVRMCLKNNIDCWCLETVCVFFMELLNLFYWWLRPKM